MSFCSWCEDAGEPCACNEGGLRPGKGLPMTLLVCGGRNFMNRNLIEWWLKRLLRPGDTVIHGAAQGADSIAGEVASKIDGVTVKAFPADWSQGRSAGVLRSRMMLLDHRPALVLAFPGNGKGTYHTINMAHDFGIKVVVGNSPSAIKEYERYKHETGEKDEQRT